MKSYFHEGKTYHLDSEGFLIDPDEWDEDFARGIAPMLKITQGLTERHWQVIHYIRQTYTETGKCPLVYRTCEKNGLDLGNLKRLFPAGYLRGACKLAGLSYKEGYLKSTWLAKMDPDGALFREEEKIYRMDALGYLADPSEWDERLAISKAVEMKMPGPLTENHWEIIRFLRDYFQCHGKIPTIFETCDASRIDLDALERLFPDGYHRGAVKIAGLKMK